MFGVFENIIFYFAYKEAVAQARLCATGVPAAWGSGYQPWPRVCPAWHHLLLEAQLRKELNLPEKQVTVPFPGGLLHPPMDKVCCVEKWQSSYENWWPGDICLATTHLTPINGSNPQSRNQRTNLGNLIIELGWGLTMVLGRNVL